MGTPMYFIATTTFHESGRTCWEVSLLLSFFSASSWVIEFNGNILFGVFDVTCGAGGKHGNDKSCFVVNFLLNFCGI